MLFQTNNCPITCTTVKCKVGTWEGAKWRTFYGCRRRHRQIFPHSPCRSEGELLLHLSVLLHGRECGQQLSKLKFFHSSAFYAKPLAGVHLTQSSELLLQGPFKIIVEGIKICDPPFLDPRNALVHADIRMRYNHTARQRVVDASLHLLRRIHRGETEVRCASAAQRRVLSVPSPQLSKRHGRLRLTMFPRKFKRLLDT